MIEKIVRVRHLVRALAVVALVLGPAIAADAAAVLRTAPFPGDNLSSGDARCVARNGGTSTATVTVRVVPGSAPTPC